MEQVARTASVLRLDMYPPPLTAPPDHFNLWRGFAVKPKEGNWSLFKAHLRDKVCGGSELSMRG